MPADECRERECGGDTHGAVQQPGERAAAGREAEREDEVGQELHLPPEAPRRRHEAAGERVEARVDELVLRLVAAHRGRQHGGHLGDEHERAHEDERPDPPESARLEGAAGARELAAARHQDGSADDRDRRRAEVARGGEPEGRHAPQTEADREPGEQALGRDGRQRAQGAQREEPRGGRGREREHEADEVDHRSPR